MDINEKLITIDFKEIYSKLMSLKPGIKISYLTAQEMNKVMNFPIKEDRQYDLSQKERAFMKNNNGICLMILSGEIPEFKPRTTTHIKDAIPELLLEIPGLKCQPIFFLNRKMAAVTAGLGQYGKNQLIYNTDFGFHHSIWTFVIYNNVINLPIRKEANYSYIDLCEGCNECIKNCPAQALHADDYPGWLDKTACQGFFQYGNHPIIPSTKYGINAFLGNKFSEEELLTIQDREKFKEMFGFQNTESIVHQNGKTYRVDMHFCKECRNQLPCRKVSYTYDKQYYKVMRVGEYEPDAMY